MWGKSSAAADSAALPALVVPKSHSPILTLAAPGSRRATNDHSTRFNSPLSLGLALLTPPRELAFQRCGGEAQHFGFFWLLLLKLLQMIYKHF
jgi:hypothetical protein